VGDGTRRERKLGRARSKNYKTKDEVVALLEKSISDVNANLKTLPDASFAKSVESWLIVMEHSAEYYGLLVAYYRANGLVPPALPGNQKTGTAALVAENERSLIAACYPLLSSVMRLRR
jgi:hypothetical protein